MVSALRGRCTGWRNIQAIAHRKGSASASRQKPAAIGPTPLLRTRNGPAGQREVADQQGDEGQRMGFGLRHTPPLGRMERARKRQPDRDP